MATAEQLAFSIREEGHGVHVLLWDDPHDLVHALLVLRAALGDLPVYSLLMSGDAAVPALSGLVEARCPIEEGNGGASALAGRLGIIFVPQAVSDRIGSWLNGWRRPLAERPGTLLVIRHADFDAFQRAAPDLSSFVGPRIYDASTMLAVFSDETARRVQTSLPPEWEQILIQLPGTLPEKVEIDRWLAVHAPGKGKDAQ